MSEVRVRIAPSPTGPLHLGTARTIAGGLATRSPLRLDLADKLVKSDGRVTAGTSEVYQAAQVLVLFADLISIAGGFLITLFLREIPLQERAQPAGAGVAEDFGMMVDGEALEESRPSVAS